MGISGHPRFSPEQAVHLVRSLFGVHATAQELSSDRDQNFCLSRPGGPKLLLKVANSQTSIEVLDLQNQAMVHLAAAGVAPIIPTAMPALTGNVVGQWGEYLVRLLTYLPGRPIAEVSDPAEALLGEVGAILGAVDQILADFSHPAADRYLRWDSRHADKVIAENMEFVGDEQRELLAKLAAAAAKHLRPHLKSLRKSIIHNDANDYNILVTGDGADTKISGLIDFGDVVHTYTVAELANCAAYLMGGRQDPIATAAQIARGYHGAYPLDEGERQSLFDLIILRLCISAAIGSRQTRQDPTNKYLAVSQRPVWALLGRLGSEDYQVNAARLYHSIGQRP